MRFLRVKRPGHEAGLTMVEHLDELRLRVVSSLLAVAAAFGLCLWRNDLVLAALNRPLGERRPVTFGIAEAFTTTLTTSAYAALVLSLPVVLYQATAYILPAFRPAQARMVARVGLLVPVLFLAGTAFAYFLVLPSAIHFLLSFNAEQFHTLVRAREYYSFVSQTVLAVGLVFQLPVIVLLLARLGLLNATQMRGARRYAYVGAAVIAMALPGVDPVSMLLETLPLIGLYELSIFIAVAAGKAHARASALPSDPLIP
jgi:sec-independent protein translocase protein TatC